MRAKFNVCIKPSKSEPWNVKEAQYQVEYINFQELLSHYFDSRGIDAKSNSAEPNKNGLIVSLESIQSEEALDEALASFIDFVHDLPRDSAYRPTFFMERELDS